MPAVPHGGSAARGAPVARSSLVTEAHTTPWRDPLARALDGRGHVALRTPDGAWTGDDLWRGARAWARALHARGLRPGDRIACALPGGPAFVMLLLAALAEGFTLAPLPPAADLDAAGAALDARATIASGDPARIVARPARGAPAPHVRLLLLTSGTTGAARWIALSDDNLRAVLESHAPQLALDGAVVLSVIPWHHAFGLVIQLLPALLARAALVREASDGRDPAAMLAAAAHGVTHLDAVPYTLQRLAALPGGRAALARLRGGVVGGAPVDAALAAVLAGTRLRVGYGQTEAAPGIALGAPGEWQAGILGRPIGCAVRIDADGVLAFRGPNACVGEWRDGALHPLPPGRWVRTGDLVQRSDDGTLLFEGRLADSFKLANGRPVAAASIEAAIRARFPAVREALLSSPDGHALLLAVATDGPAPDAASVARLLGGLASRPLRVVRVPADAWVRTPKGELDRRHPLGATAG